MSNRKFYKVGAIFNDDGRGLIEVIENKEGDSAFNTCMSKCVYGEATGCKAEFACSSNEREDGKQVHFEYAHCIDEHINNPLGVKK